MRPFKGTHSTISSRRQWILSARVACRMNQWNCGRNTDNWTIADSFISVFPGGQSPTSQRRNSASIPDTHVRFVVYRMTLGQHFFTHFRSTLSQCSSERYSQRIIRLCHRNPTTTKNMYPSSRTGYTAILSVFLPPIEIHTECNRRYKTATSIYTLRITWSFSRTGKRNGTWKYTAEDSIWT
jgi:hypothetical protein